MPPFFSILLPTKNRSEIVGGAIQSALRQTFPDFELIISDNDDSPTATRDAVAKFNDPRIRYFRTSGKLPMHENWENALNQAAGEYVLILEDKMRLVGNALEIMRGLIEKHGRLVISYDIKFAREETIPDPKGSPGGEVWRADDVAQLFCQFAQLFFTIHPKSLDSASPIEVVRKAKANSPTGLFFSYVTPDYSSGFQILSTVEKILFVRESLVYIPNNWMWKGKFSIGQSSYKKEALTARWLQELPVKVEEIQAFAPVKCKWLWINNVLYDFRTKYKTPQTQPPLNWVKYHGFCVMIVLMGKRLGADMSMEVEEIKKSLGREGFIFKLKVLFNIVERLFAAGLQMIRTRIKQA